MYEYKAKCINVVDGDTIDVVIDLGFKTSIEKRVRVAEIDTPELRRGTTESKRLGKIAADRVRELILGKDIVVQTVKLHGKFGRYIARVFFAHDDTTKANLGDVLIVEGHAVLYGSNKGR